MAPAKSPELGLQIKNNNPKLVGGAKKRSLKGVRELEGFLALQFIFERATPVFEKVFCLFCIHNTSTNKKMK